MRIKIIMLGSDPDQLVPDAALLREKNFLVYTCDQADNIKELISEINPDLIFLNADNSDKNRMLYNALLADICCENIPIIYTITEDELYLIHRKKIASKERRNIFSDNIVDGIKRALRSNKTSVYTKNQLAKINLWNYSFPQYARA